MTPRTNSFGYYATKEIPDDCTFLAIRPSYRDMLFFPSERWIFINSSATPDFYDQDFTIIYSLEETPHE